MYLYHFGIRQLPFTLTPNTQFYFGLPSHKEALDVLQTALNAGEGFIKVTGEVGTGKSLICRKLLNELSDGFVTAYIPNPYLSPQELRKAVADELQVDLKGGDDQQAFSSQLQTHLVNIRKQNKAALLIIDEAQALPDESIEALRLMTNLETEANKLMQVVLFGQPELDEKLNKVQLRQLKQRITFSYQLKTMNSDQIKQYIQHRLLAAGHPNGEVFDLDCCKLLQKYTKGTPRLVNILAHKAMMLAYGEGVNMIDKAHIKAAALDTEAAFNRPGSIFQRWHLASAAVAALAVLLSASAFLQEDYSQLLSLVFGWQP